jgi:enhancer of yellow 2 transcription factor
LQQKLVECGWRDQVKAYCKEVVKQKGLDNITVEELVLEMVPKGRGI